MSDKIIGYDDRDAPVNWKVPSPLPQNASPESMSAELDALRADLAALKDERKDWARTFMLDGRTPWEWENLCKRAEAELAAAKAKITNLESLLRYPDFSAIAAYFTDGTLGNEPWRKDADTLRAKLAAAKADLMAAQDARHRLGHELADYKENSALFLRERDEARAELAAAKAALLEVRDLLSHDFRHIVDAAIAGSKG